jgi:hypothetical protein
MSGPASPVRQHALAFMGKVLAFHKARRESPDFDGFLRRIKQLGRIQMHSAGPSALLAAYGRTLRVIAASAVFGLSDKHAHVLVDLYLSGFGHGFHGIEALSNSAIPPSLHGERDDQPTFPFLTKAARYAPSSTGAERNGWRSC